MSIEHVLERQKQEYLFDNSNSYTESIIKENPELGPKKAKIEIELPFNPELPTTILLPGIVNTSDIVFRKQKTVLQSEGQNVASVEYSSSGYSQELVKAQLKDFMQSVNHNQKFNIIGLSIGARTALELLSDLNTNEQKRVDSAILLGLVYSDLDLKNDLFGRLTHIANRITPDQVLTKFSCLVKRYIKTDPLYVSNMNGDLATRQVNDLSSEVIVDMFDTLSSSSPISEVKSFNGIRAGIGWWEDDHASSGARQRVASLFSNVHEFSIRGHHGWTETGADDINTAIRKVISGKSFNPTLN